MSKLSYQRLDEILDMLINCSTYVSTQEFSTNFSVSARTIRTDLRNLNDVLNPVGATITLLRGKGYFLDIYDKSLFNDWLHKCFNSSPIFLNSPQERQRYLLYTLLKDSEPISLDEFLDILLVSKNTFYSYLKTIRDMLAPYHLKIVNRPNIGFEMKGHEFYKRRVMSDLLIRKDLQEYLVTFTDLERELFSGIDLDALTQIELSYLAPLNLNASDYYHKNIISHFAIALSRNKNGHELTSFPVEVPPLKKEVQEVFLPFLAIIEERFQLTLNEHEKNYFIYYLALNTPRLIDNLGNESAISSKSCQIVTDLLLSIKQTGNFDCQDDQVLITDLTSHIEGYLKVLAMNETRINPWLHNIKKAFPLAYDLSLSFFKKSEADYNLIFTDDEVGYVTLSIAGSIERHSNLNPRKYRVIITCATGFAMGRILEEKIKKRYPNSIEVIGHFSLVELKQMDLSDIDFVVSTILLEPLNIPYVYVNMCQVDTDVESISFFLDKIKFQKLSIFDLFEPDIFFINPKVSTKQELLKLMSTRLEQAGVVDTEFYTEVMNREEVGATNITSTLATPHPFVLTAKKSRIAIAILPKGLEWEEDERVQFVFLFALKQEDYQKTTGIYNPLITLMDQEENQKKMLGIKHYDEFIDYLKHI